MATQQFKIPTNPAQWRAPALRTGVYSKSLHSPRSYDSASKMQEEQYLLLRALWSSPGLNKLDVGNEVGQQYADKAALVLRQSKHWRSYQDELNDKPRPRALKMKDIGFFAISLHRQATIIESELEQDDALKLVPQDELLRHVTNGRERRMAREGITPRKREPPTRLNLASPNTVNAVLGPATPPNRMLEDLTLYETPGSAEHVELSPSISADDESVVNMALVEWLDAVLGTCQEIEIRCLPTRQAFTFFKSWKALTDETLQENQRQERVIAILEAKRYRRQPAHQTVRRQEAGEMVCWIASDKDDHGCYCIESVTTGSSQSGTRYKRLLIAQDCGQIWVVTANYDDRYRSYILDGDPCGDDKTFLYLTEFGPFSVWKKRDMEKAATMILAFSLQHSEKMSEEGRNHLR